MASNTLSSEAFSSRIPTYVELVHSLTGAIINKALARPHNSVQMCVLLPTFPPTNSDTQERVPTTDPDLIAYLWQNQRPDCMFEVEVALGDLSLSLLNNPTQMTGGWIHRPETPADIALPRQINTPIPKLLSPVLTFDRAWKIPSATPASIYIFAESTYNQGQLDPSYGRHQNIMRIPAEFYTQAFNPPLSETDTQVLQDGGIYALHAHKIDSLIDVMRGVALD